MKKFLLSHIIIVILFYKNQNKALANETSDNNLQVPDVVHRVNAMPEDESLCESHVSRISTLHLADLFHFKFYIFRVILMQKQQNSIYM